MEPRATDKDVQEARRLGPRACGEIDCEPHSNFSERRGCVQCAEAIVSLVERVSNARRLADKGCEEKCVALRRCQEKRDALVEALKELVTVNEVWNRDVQAIIGRPPGWADTYLDKARAALKAAGVSE